MTNTALVTPQRAQLGDHVAVHRHVVGLGAAAAAQVVLGLVPDGEEDLLGVLLQAGGHGVDARCRRRRWRSRATIMLALGFQL